MSNADAPGCGVVEGVAPLPAPSVKGVTTLVGVGVGGGGGVIDDYEPSQEKSKEEEGTQAKADQKKSKKGGGHKYLLSVLGRRLKKSKPFKLTWKILRGIGRTISVLVRVVSEFVYILAFGIIFGTVCFIIFGIPYCIATAYVCCSCPFSEGLAHKLQLA